MKSKKLLLFFTVLYFTTQAQTDITLIIPDLVNQKIDKLEVFDYSQIDRKVPAVKDTSKVSFAKKIIDCYVVRLTSGGRAFHKQVWLEPGASTVRAHINKNNLIIDTVIGGSIHYKISKFNDAYTASLRKDTSATNAFLLQSFKEHIDNPFSITIGIYYLLLNINSKENLQKLQDLIAIQKDKFNWYILHTSLYDRLNFLTKQSKVDLSKYKFVNTENKTAALDLKKSDYLVIQFWFTKNKLSMQDHLSIKSLIAPLKTKSTQLISISIDQDYDPWKNYINTAKLEWPHYMEAKENLLTDFLYIDNFPTYMILDQKGNVVKTFFSLKQVQEYFGIG